MGVNSAVSATAEAQPWRRASNGVVLRLRLTPKSSRSAIEGVTTTADGPAVQARVNAVPENGAANQALAELVAGWIGCPKGAVTLVSGGKSRIKSLAIAGAADDLERRLLSLIGSRKAPD
jgi:uncharacterized protein YggU (UPF0235/DUF167 family)